MLFLAISAMYARKLLLSLLSLPLVITRGHVLTNSGFVSCFHFWKKSCLGLKRTIFSYYPMHHSGNTLSHCVKSPFSEGYRMPFLAISGMYATFGYRHYFVCLSHTVHVYVNAKEEGRGKTWISCFHVNQLSFDVL